MDHARTTQDRPKIDRIACPWLMARFIDENPEFLYVPGCEVMKIAAETGAISYDLPNVELGHHGDQCSFDVLSGSEFESEPSWMVSGMDTR